ncbi:MAG: FCD domain-containing protein [Sphingomonadales bacterium]|nr:FCD domain-containing protein [Sphingomonadales bacterium]
MPGLDAPRALRIHQDIARRLGIAILSGQHLPGSAFGGEIEQSEALGVSRTAYREAMRILTAKGLIESRPKAGTHVTPRARWNLLDPEMLAWMFSGEPDPGFIRDLFELRGIIEPAAAALAARRRTPQQLDDMRAALAAMAAHGLAAEAGQAADREFHRLILAASGNEALIALAGSVGAAVQWTTRFKQRATPTPRDPVPEHAALCDAIVAADADAARDRMAHLIGLALADMALDG